MADITQLQGTAGPRNLAAGESAGVRLNRSGSGILTAPISARLQEAVLRGNCYTVANQAGVTSQAGLSATTPVMTLYNPIGSGKNLVVWYAGCTFTVVFATVGAVWVAVNTNTAAAATTGTPTSTHRNCLLGASDTMAAKPMLAATLPAAPVAVSILGAGLTGAVNLLPQAQTMGRWFDGGLVLKPNTAVTIQTGVASGTSGMFCEFIWEEVDA